MYINSVPRYKWSNVLINVAIVYSQDNADYVKLSKLPNYETI